MDKVPEMNYNVKREVKSLRPFTQLNEQTRVRYHCALNNATIYTSNSFSPKLTKLSKYYMWKPGGTLPMSIVCPNDDMEIKVQHRRLNQGLSFRLVKAFQYYECLKTNRIINSGEYHFANKHGKRYCIDAFMEMFPERAKELLNKADFPGMG